MPRRCTGSPLPRAGPHQHTAECSHTAAPGMMSFGSVRGALDPLANVATSVILAELVRDDRHDQVERHGQDDRAGQDDTTAWKSTVFRIGCDLRSVSET